MTVVERDYPDIYKKFTSLGPLLDKLGNGGKGINWNTEHEVTSSATERRVTEPGVSQGRPRSTPHRRLRDDPDLAPETNGHVAVKAWEALGKITGRDHTHLASAASTTRSASATCRRSRARSSRRRPGRAGAKKSATTPATPTCTS
jgi:nitrate reductase alpha subunit